MQNRLHIAPIDVHRWNTQAPKKKNQQKRSYQQRRDIPYNHNVIVDIMNAILIGRDLYSLWSKCIEGTLTMKFATVHLRPWPYIVSPIIAKIIVALYEFGERKKKDQLGVGWFEIIYKHMVLKSFNQKQGNKDTRIQELAECYIICGNTTAIDRGQ